MVKNKAILKLANSTYEGQKPLSNYVANYYKISYIKNITYY